MTGTAVRVVTVIMFGLFALGCGLGWYGSWQSYQAEGAHFLSNPSGRHGFTSFDQMIGLGVLTVLCSLAFVGSLFALLSRSAVKPIESPPAKAAEDSSAGPAWTCPGCGEENPGTFEECWKCQRNRPLKDES